MCVNGESACYMIYYALNVVDDLGIRDKVSVWNVAELPEKELLEHDLFAPFSVTQIGVVHKNVRGVHDKELRWPWI